MTTARSESTKTESMNMSKLSDTLREHADRIQKHQPRRDDDMDNAELVRVLARMVEGKSAQDAFGAPGDWGYSNPIGRAIAETL